jgi:CubicO group peptidase (beta-lactamase class C family)
MEHVTWWRGLHGVSSGGTGIGSTARDLARFGEFVLNRGRWDGRQIVPERWLKRATRPRSSLGHGRGYGYGWWTTARDGLGAYAAVGFGGQVVAMVPQLDLVFVMASDTAGVPADWESVLFRQIVPAAHGNT